MKNLKLLTRASLIAVAATFGVTAASAADVILSGAIKSAAGKKLGGVTVSAKADGQPITTTVFTDESGSYYFPPMPAGKYHVWAQALTFNTAKSDVDLGAAKRNCPDTNCWRRCRTRRRKTHA
jgi:hypothetical protein